MKTLWLNFSGTDIARQNMKLSQLPYPLLYNLPTASWEIGKSNIELLKEAKNPTIYIDVVLEIIKLDNGVFNHGYRFCIGIGDDQFIDSVEIPTVRDRGVCKYYSRWPKEYNVVGDFILNEIDSNKELGIIIGDKVEKNSLLFDHTSDEIINFLSEITSLNNGDLISLGSIMIKELEPFNDSLTVTLVYDDIEWSVQIDYES